MTDQENEKPGGWADAVVICTIVICLTFIVIFFRWAP